MGYGNCKICGEPVLGHPIVRDQLIDGEPPSFAHGHCWVDAGRKVALPAGPFNDCLDFSWVPEHSIAEKEAN